MAMTSYVLRLIKSVAVILITVGILVIIAAWLLAEYLIFAPAPQSYALPYPGIEPVAYDDDRTLATAWLPNPQSSWTLLYSHGNGEDLAQIMPRLELMRAAGWSVMVHDYPELWRESWPGIDRSDGARYHSNLGSPGHRPWC